MDVSKMIKLKVKSPSSCISDIELEAALDTSVIQIKDIITARYPGNPPSSDQKLLYAGKLLSDDETLKDFLRFDTECTVYSLHLACSSPVPKTKANDDLRTGHEPKRNLASEEVNHNLDQTTLGNLGWQWQQMMMGIYGMNVSEDVYGSLGPTELQQIALVQQMYSQYLSEYMHNSLVDNQLSTGNPPLPQQMDMQAPDRDGDEGQRMNQGQVMNAGGGGPIDEQQDLGLPGGNHDMLDWLYVMSRVVVLASIVYFYSNLTRFMIVAGVVGLLYLYQTGYFGRHERANVNREVHRIRARDANERDPPNEAEANENNENSSLESNSDNIEEVEPEEVPVNPLYIARDFIALFFASIIPENNQVAQ